jgi:hypothetical protein
MATTQRRHNCDERHASFTSFAQCAFPRATVLSGEGAYITGCIVGTMVLHENQYTAWDSVRDGVGGNCTGTGCEGHVVRVLVKP